MTVYSYRLFHLEPDPAQICRYLGMAPHDTPPQLMSQITAVAAEAGQLGQFRALYALLPVSVSEGALRLGPLALPGQALIKHLAGCDRAAVFCAPAGAGFDRKIQSQRLRPSLQTIWDAAGTAAVEAFCDALCARLGPGPSRFSPGYGDLPLACQREILELLGAASIGVGLTDSLLMTPTKSVTAIQGLYPTHGA